MTRDDRDRAGIVVNAMTVDVEDYFQVSAFDDLVPRARWNEMASRVQANTEQLLSVFAAHGVRATFFVLGWVADRFPALVRQIAQAGHELASHGFGHRLVYDQTPDAFRWDVRRAKLVIEDSSGQRVVGYRAPSYSITRRSLWALDILCDEGYEYDASVFPIRHDRYGIPGSPRHAYSVTCDAGTLVEVPASTARLVGVNLPVAGGGYFRLLPYAWTRWGIRRINRRERRPAVFYLHPWEVDPWQPRLPVGRLTRYRHYHNLRKTAPRLERLLDEFSFAPLRDVLKHVEIETAAPALASVARPAEEW